MVWIDDTASQHSVQFMHSPNSTGQYICPNLSLIFLYLDENFEAFAAIFAAIFVNNLACDIES